MTLSELRAALEAAEARRTAIAAAAEARFADPDDTTEVRSAFIKDADGNDTAELDMRFGGYTEAEAEEARGLDTEIAELTVRAARMSNMAQRSDGAIPAAADIQFGSVRTSNPHDFDQTRGASLGEVRGQAMTAIEHTTGVDDDTRSGMVSRLEMLDNPVAYRHAIATSAPEFRQYFMNEMFGRASSPEQVRANQIAGEQRAALGLGSGQITPVTLDPTLIMTGDVEINPLRQLSDVQTITTPLAQFNTMGNMVGSMDLEHEEVSDDTPSVSGDSINIRKGELYGEYSIELEMDMPAFETALRRNLARGKDNLEAVQLMNGDDSAKQVEGLLVGMANSAIANLTSNTVGALDEDDFTDLVANIQNVHRSRGVFISALTTQHLIRKLEDGNGNRIWQDSLRAGEPSLILGHGSYEGSQMPAVATGNTPVVFGNLREGFRILDRVGMTVVPVGMVKGANNRPNGNRGVYAYFRFGSKVVNPNAIRVLEIA